MSRHDGKLTAAGEALDAAELLQELRARAGSSAGERSVAIVQYLSADEGWRDALKVLGGAFAEPPEPSDEPGDRQQLSGSKDA